jgi:hypothetical protein
LKFNSKKPQKGLLRPFAFEKTMNKYQGDDITLSIQLVPKSDTDKQSLDEFTKVVVYAYTDSCFMSKFSYPEAAGYNPLTKANATFLFGIIPSVDTKKMLGNLIVELMFESESAVGDSKENSSKKINTGIVIVKSQVKNEI